MRPLPPDGSGHPAGIGGLLTNPSLMSALLSCLAAQLLKPLAHQYLHPEKRLDWKWAVSPGGMPSSHTAFVVGLTTALGMLEGTQSNLFALALVLSLVVAYDATGVRLHAGRHASVLNIMIAELPPEHPASETSALQETLGHTPVQVAAGAGVGLLVGLTLISLLGVLGWLPGAAATAAAAAGSPPAGL